MDNQQLIQRIEALEKWQKERQSQQIAFPLDTNSISVLNKYFLSIINFDLFNTAVSGQEFRKLLIKQNDKINLISCASSFITFSANASTNFITFGTNLITGAPGIIGDGAFVVIYSPGTPPGGLDNAGGYFTVNSTGSTSQLSVSPGGAAIDITSAGVGTHYISIE